MIVVLTDEARADLDRIGAYIARDNPRRAASFVREIAASCLDLADNPRAFPLVPRYEDRGVRRRVHGSYLVFYRVRADRIEVLHILHGAQDLEALLFPPG